MKNLLEKKRLTTEEMSVVLSGVFNETFLKYTLEKEQYDSFGRIYRYRFIIEGVCEIIIIDDLIEFLLLFNDTRLRVNRYNFKTFIEILKKSIDDILNYCEYIKQEYMIAIVKQNSNPNTITRNCEILQYIYGRYHNYLYETFYLNVNNERIKL